MYFLRLKPLKEELATRGLSEKERYRYLLWWMAFISLTAWSGTQSAGALKAPLLLANLAITILGIRYAFRQNGREEGKALLDRYFSIAWVMNIRVMIVLLVIGQVLFALPGIRDAVDYVDSATAAFAFQFSTEEYSEELGMVNALLVLLAETYLAVVIARHIGDVHRAAEGLGRPPQDLPQGQGRLPAEQSRQQLDRFVESVVQREVIVDEPTVRRRGRKQVRKTTRRAR
jgi:hypothetical protein